MHVSRESPHRIAAAVFHVNHLPMQNSEKIAPSTSSTSTAPAIRPSGSAASRSSSARSSSPASRRPTAAARLRAASRQERHMPAGPEDPAMRIGRSGGALARSWSTDPLTPAPDFADTSISWRPVGQAVRVSHKINLAADLQQPAHRSQPLAPATGRSHVLQQQHKVCRLRTRQRPLDTNRLNLARHPRECRPCRSPPPSPRRDRAPPERDRGSCPARP